MSQSATVSSHKCSNRRWSPLNIFLMIVGFIVFWPLGLAMLAWIVWGDEIRRVAGELKSQFSSQFGSVSRPAHGWAQSYSATGNMAFDEYRAKELKRLEEERRKIDAMRAEFEEFLNEVRRAKDQEEFERFMAAFEKRSARSSGKRGSKDNKDN